MRWEATPGGGAPRRTKERVGIEREHSGYAYVPTELQLEISENMWDAASLGDAVV